MVLFVAAIDEPSLHETLSLSGQSEIEQPSSSRKYIF